MSEQIPMILIQRFWRVPKPSCNWNPRLTRITLPSAGDVHIWIDGHDDANKTLQEQFNAKIYIDLGTFEITKREFKQIKRELK